MTTSANKLQEHFKIFTFQGFCTEVAGLRLSVDGEKLSVQFIMLNNNLFPCKKKIIKKLRHK